MHNLLLRKGSYFSQPVDGFVHCSLTRDAGVLYFRAKNSPTVRAHVGAHIDCTPPIVHRDLKSANILLDDEYVAHVADFGLAKLIYSDQSSSSSVYVGSHGYMASECRYGVRSSPMQDVFSFGVVLLELVTGKSAVVDAEEGRGESRGLAEWAATINKNKGHVVLDLIDPELLSDYEKWGDEIEKVVEISLLCTRPSPRERPSMRTVVDSLSPSSALVLEY